METIKIYPPKRNYALRILAIFILVGTVFLLFYDLLYLAQTTGQYIGAIIGLSIMIPLSLYVLISNSKLSYTVDSQSLFVTEGVFIKRKIPIKAIRKVEQTFNIRNAPTTTTMNRLEIFYNEYNSIQISPEKEKDLIKDLLNVNPQIEVKYRNQRKAS